MIKKELSIEEKAKRYDEAKARMSIAYNSNRCTIGFMNEIFPELKESEDEMIRKVLIELSKEVALKAYPPKSIAANYDTINRRDAFEYGYLKAEKDHELTWEDIKEIYFLFRAVLNEWYGHGFSDEGICREVLKRFKERKQQ